MAAEKPLRLKSTGELTRFKTGDFLAEEHGGTGATTYAQARTNLGLVIGTNVQAWAAMLDAIVALGSNGIIVRTGAGAAAARTITGTAGRVGVTNGDGAAGNPTIDLATVSNAGGGSLLKFTHDTYGRVTGSSAVATADLTPLLDATYVNISGDTLTGFLTAHANPTNPMHLATKEYVDQVAAGGQPNWASVRAVSTSNITLSGAQTIDGVSIIAGDRVLVTGQTTGSANGIYVAAAGAWSRATDADAAGEFTPGRGVFVNEGTTYADSTWAFVNNAEPTVGSTTLMFTQTSGLGQVVAGAGTTKTGNTIDVGTASSARIVVNADNIDLATVSNAGTGTFYKVQFDAYGRCTGYVAVAAADIAALLDADLTALADASGTGLYVRTGPGSSAQRTITGVAGRTTVSNGDGVAGNPQIDLATSGITPGTYNGITFDAYGRATGAVASSSERTVTSLTNGEASAIAIGRAVYSSAAGAVKLANANASATVHVVGLVQAASISAAAAGDIATAGVVEATTGQWDAVTGQTGGLTFGARYYLSNTTAGALTTTTPSSGFVMLVGVALSTTKMALQIGPVVEL